MRETTLQRKETKAVSEAVSRVKQRFSIIGNSPALAEAIERAVKVAPIDLSVLVTGESGSGKEFFPKIIHNLGARKHKKYIAVNCGAIPEGTIDSELFGHEKGSFTGAVSSRKGYFEEANGGTIFLDEVAELPLTTQARLLRVLETGEFLKVGSSEVQKTDVRIVAATNVDLLRAVSEGKFREDLYYRLSTVIIEVPNLHDRGDDIPLLARKFVSDFSEKYMTEPITFSPEARDAMLAYRWPGNVRQLKNVVEQLCVFHAGTEIRRKELVMMLPMPSAADAPLAATQNAEAEREMMWQAILSLKAEIASLKARVDQGVAGGISTVRASEILDEDLPASKSLVRYSPAPGVCDLEMAVENSERSAIAAALRRNGGNKRKAAEELNISARTLYRKIREFNLADDAGMTEHPFDTAQE